MFIILLQDIFTNKLNYFIWHVAFCKMFLLRTGRIGSQGRFVLVRQKVWGLKGLKWRSVIFLKELLCWTVCSSPLSGYYIFWGICNWVKDMFSVCVAGTAMLQWDRSRVTLEKLNTHINFRSVWVGVGCFTALTLYILSHRAENTQQKQ